MLRANGSAIEDLADLATIAIIQHEAAVDVQTLNLQLSQALQSRITIEQDKGKISQAAGLDMDGAFQRLRNHARNHNLHLSRLATDIANGTIDARRLDPLGIRVPTSRAGSCLFGVLLSPTESPAVIASLPPTLLARAHA